MLHLTKDFLGFFQLPSLGAFANGFVVVVHIRDKSFSLDVFEDVDGLLRVGLLQTGHILQSFIPRNVAKSREESYIATSIMSVERVEGVATSLINLDRRERDVVVVIYVYFRKG